MLSCAVCYAVLCVLGMLGCAFCCPSTECHSYRGEGVEGCGWMCASCTVPEQYMVAATGYAVLCCVPRSSIVRVAILWAFGFFMFASAGLLLNQGFIPGLQYRSRRSSRFCRCTIVPQTLLVTTADNEVVLTVYR